MVIMTSLTVLVPVFNEEETVFESLQRLNSLDFVSEIIVLNDGSIDGTAEVVEKVKITDNRIKLISFKKNEGKGAVLDKSRRYISSDYVVIHDADLEYFPNDFHEMIKLANGKNMVLGSRFIGNKSRSNVYLRTYYANRFMSLFFSLVNIKYVSDVSTCYKMMPSNFFKTTKFKEKGFSIEIEMISRFLKVSREITEVPISYRGRSYQEGKKIKFVDGILYLMKTVQYKFLN